MHTECAEVGSNLRKYRFYIGQGIPDPWLIHPQAYNSRLFPPCDREAKNHGKHSEYSRGPCICCQREYLFECPDKCASKYCSYTDGNSKNTLPVPHSDNKCKCNELFQNRGEPSSPNDSSSDSENEGENLNEDLKNPPFCECFINRKIFSTCSEKSGCTNGESCEKPFKPNKNYVPFRGNRKICFCPFVRQFCVKKASENEDEKISPPEQKTVVSKEIQTDGPLTKNSKTVQTEKPVTKAQPKCTCANKYLTCNYNCNPYKQWSRKGCQPIYSIPNICCPSGFLHNPALTCPYSFMNHFTLHKCDRHDSGEVKKHRRKKKQQRERENEEDSNAEFDNNQPLQNANENSMPIGRTKWEFADRETSETPREASKHTNYNEPEKNFDHFKYLTDDKLKNYLKGSSQTIFNFPQPAYTGAKFFGFPQGDSLFQNAGFERFKTFSYNKPFESNFMESKMKLRGSNLFASNIKPSYYSDQTPFGLTEMRSNKNNVINKASEDATDYDDRRSCGFVRSQTNFTKAFRKRRRFLVNEKRRKLASNKPPSFLEYQMSSNKPATCPAMVVEKETQVQETPQDYVNLEKIFHAENFNSSSGFFNFDKNSQTKVKDFTFCTK